jgi:hypothetical protein
MKNLFDEDDCLRGGLLFAHAGIPPHVRKNILRFREKGYELLLKILLHLKAARRHRALLGLRQGAPDD